MCGSSIRRLVDLKNGVSLSSVSVWEFLCGNYDGLNMQFRGMNFVRALCATRREWVINRYPDFSRDSRFAIRDRQSRKNRESR